MSRVLGAFLFTIIHAVGVSLFSEMRMRKQIGSNLVFFFSFCISNHVPHLYIKLFLFSFWTSLFSASSFSSLKKKQTKQTAGLNYAKDHRFVTIAHTLEIIKLTSNTT